MQPTDQTSTAIVSIGFSHSESGKKRTSFGVALEAQHDLRSAIPSCRNILRHVSRILLGINGEATRQAKVTDFQLAIGIDQQVTGLQISVQNIGRMDILQSAKNLVDEGLEMGIGQRLSRTNDGGQIAFHQFCASQHPTTSGNG